MDKSQSREFISIITRYEKAVKYKNSDKYKLEQKENKSSTSQMFKKTLKAKTDYSANLTLPPSPD
tara:strand:- start:70 stop:264 length:195 start_codon:yes stop_codon:yes gene_type:complete